MGTATTDTTLGMAEEITVATLKVYSSRLNLAGSVRFESA